jgi:amino acid transporter
MKLNLGRATILGILLWVLIFVELSVLMFSGLSNLIQKIIHFALLLVFALICGKIYFNKKNEDGWKEGFLLGVWMIIIGSVLDLLITIPFFVKSYETFYFQWSLWLGFVEVIILTTISGMIFKKKKRGKK